MTGAASQRSVGPRTQPDVEDKARDATRKAARMLIGSGIAPRDAADLLGVSHQRVAQLVSAVGPDD